MLATPGSSHAQSVNHTWLHYDLVNGANVARDIEQTRMFMNRTRFGVENKKSLDGILMARFDLMSALPGLPGQNPFTFYTGAFAYTFRGSDFVTDVAAGAGAVGEAGGEISLANMVWSAQTTYKAWWQAGVNVSANYLTSPGATGFSFDQLTAHGRLPFLGAFTDVHYTIGDSDLRCHPAKKSVVRPILRLTPYGTQVDFVVTNRSKVGMVDE